jgi:hypothetical protein
LLEVFLSKKLTQFSKNNNVQDVAVSNILGFLWRHTCVSSTQLNRSFGANRAYFHLENIIIRKYSFKKVTQFSQGNNALSFPASNIEGFLWKDKHVSST